MNNINLKIVEISYHYLLIFIYRNIIYIEYDGEQHFKRYKFEKDDNNLNIRKLRDKIKTDFCKKNNIKLIRIKYTDFKKIESILNKNFKF